MRYAALDSGSRPPDGAEASTSDITFEDLGLGEAMLASLRSSGYTRPTPIQDKAFKLLDLSPNCSQ